MAYFSSSIKTMLDQCSECPLRCECMFRLKVNQDDEVIVYMEGNEVARLSGANAMSIALTYCNLHRNFDYTRSQEFINGVLAGITYARTGGQL